MSKTDNDTILIKRYASRRLYNTETSDYVTLEEIANFIKEGKDIKIVDRKTGDDITRQYLLQIITDYETRGENLLPINVLTDIVRSYSDQAHCFIPDFLSESFEMLKQQQQEAIKTFQENVGKAMPIPQVPKFPAMQGFEEWQKMQSAFMGQMMSNWQNYQEANPETELHENTKEAESSKQNKKTKTSKDKSDDQELAAIKQQLNELQNKLKDL